MASTRNSISIPLENQTGLPNSDFTIYVLGFSTASKKQLMLNGASTTATFASMPQESGTLPAYQLDDEITAISVDISPPLDASKQINGARIYFFVANNKTFPNPPVVTYSSYGANVQNVGNPPNDSCPPYTFSEFTIVDLNYGAVID